MDPLHRSIVLLYSEGFSQLEISRLCYCSQPTVSRVLRKYRISKRNRLNIQLSRLPYQLGLF